MNRRQSSTLIAFVAMFFMASSAIGQDGKNALYPKMAPLDQYLIADRNAEIILAQSAAPKSIAGDAKVLVLGRKGYETALEGKNGFVCMVQRSWAASVDDPEFWNPKLRAPICFNVPAAESDLPHIIKKTEWALASLSRAEIADKMKAAMESKQLQTPLPGSMCYMLSKQQYLSDRGGHWHPHLMFFLPPVDPASWGAGLTGSPMLGFKDSLEQVTVFMLPVERWSDGSVAEN